MERMKKDGEFPRQECAAFLCGEEKLFRVLASHCDLMCSACLGSGL